MQTEMEETIIKSQDFAEPIQAVGTDDDKVNSGRFVGLIRSLRNWISRVNKNAAQARELFQKQAHNNTVEEYVHEDLREIKSANLAVILILAAPGTPVLSLIHKLADVYNLYHLNVGALLQKEIEIETKLQDEAHHLMHRGIAVPRAFIFELVRRQMAIVCKQNRHKGFILTEYPTTFGQTRDFFNYVCPKTILTVHHICKPDFVLYIEFSNNQTLENMLIYLKFQVRASKVLRKLHPDLRAVATEQAEKFQRDINKIKATYHDYLKVIDASSSPEYVCREIMKWIERSAVMHKVIPPLFVDPPLATEEDRDV